MRISIHTSDRTNFKRCRQRWDFSSNLRGNLEPIPMVQPLFFGTGVHESLATYYEPSTPRDASLAVEVFQAYIRGWLQSLGNPSEDDYMKANEMSVLGVGMLEYYYKWALKNDDFDVVWVEKDYDVTVPGMDGVEYSFRIDGLIQDRNGRYWVLEHKTTAQFWDSGEWLGMDDQCGSYLWGLTRLEPPIYAEGVVYNELKKKTPQPLRELSRGGYSLNRAQDTTFEIALSTLREEYGKIPEKYWDFLDYLKYKPNNFVRRSYVRRNRQEIQMLGAMMREEILDMVNSPSIYRSPSRINCSVCPFIVPCMVKWEGGPYEELLESEFMRRRGYYGRNYAEVKSSVMKGAE